MLFLIIADKFISFFKRQNCAVRKLYSPFIIIAIHIKNKFFFLREKKYNFISVKPSTFKIN